MRPKTNYSLWQRLAGFLITIICFFLFVEAFLPLCAQTPHIGDDTATPIPGVGHDYIHALDETVNPANGSVNLHITLPMPKGRGVDFPFAFTYNSGSVVTVEQDGSNPYLPLAIMPPNLSAHASTLAASGWDDTFPYLSRTVGLQSYQSANNPCIYSENYIFRDASGTIHTFFDSAGNAIGASGENPNVTGSGNTCSGGPNISGDIFTDGDTFQAQLYSCNSGCSEGYPGLAVSSSDGLLYYFNSSSVTVPQLNPYGYLTSTNPYTVYDFPVYIKDRNGNTIQMLSSPADTLGRTLPSESDAPSTKLTVGSVSYTIAYTSISASYTLASQQVSPAPNPGFHCTESFAFGTGLGGVQSITLPNNMQYKFYYGQASDPDPSIINPYGLLSEIVYPDGGYVKYTWKLSNNYSEVAIFNASGYQPATAVTDAYYPEPQGNGCMYQYETPVIATREVGVGTAAPTLRQSFTYATAWQSNQYVWSSKTTTIDTTDLIRNQSNRVVSTYGYGYAPTNAFSSLIPYSAIASQIAIESSKSTYDWVSGSVASATGRPQVATKLWNNPAQLACEFTTTAAGLSAGHFYKYSFGEVSDDKQYDFGQVSAPATFCASPSSSVVPARETITNYMSQQRPLGVYAYGFPSGIAFQTPSSTLVYGNGKLLRETDFSYDQTSLYPVDGPALPSNTHDDTLYPAAVVAGRGNLTTMTEKCTPSCNNQTTSYAYDVAGQVITGTDGRNNTTTYSYTDNPVGGNTAGNSDAYLTKVTNALGYSSSYSYSYPLDQLKSATDENSQVTSYAYADPLNRPTQVNYSGGGEKTIVYDDGNPISTVTTSTLMNASGQWMASTSTSDGFGRVTRTSVQEPAPQSPMTTDTVYDGSGKVFSRTNPYQGSVPALNTTFYYYDALGRPIETVEQDQSTLQWCYDGVASFPVLANCSALLGSVGSGSWVDSTDEAGNHSQRASDAFGDLTEVMEPNASNAPTLETDYKYDALGDLQQVDQWGGAHGTTGDRQRIFTYDSLSRLITSTNPETGYISYTYDGDSNLVQKTSPAVNAASGTQILGYCYDALNRLVGKWSAAAPTGCTSTPTTVTPSLLATYAYDTGAQANNPHGHLVNEQSYLNSVLTSENSPTTYDAVGRLLNEQECTPANCTGTWYQLAYTYDLAGNVLTSTNGLQNPSITETMAYDMASRLTQISASWPTTGSPTPVTSTWNQATHVKTLFQANATNAYGPGGLQNAVLGVNPTTSQPMVNMTRAYDNRLRVLSEADMDTSIDAAGPVGTISLYGSQSGGAAETATVTISGSEEVIGFDPATTPAPSGCQQVTATNSNPPWSYCYDVGGGGFVINEIQVSNGQVVTDWGDSLSYGQSSTASSIASYLAGEINAGPPYSVGGPYKALVNGSVISLSGTLAYPITDTDTLGGGIGCSSPFSSSCSFAMSIQGPFIAATGNVSATINGTTVSTAYNPTLSLAAVTSALAQAIQSAFSGSLTASASNGTIQLASVKAGTIWNITTSVTPTGVSSGPTAYSAVYQPQSTYSYTIPSIGGYAPNGNLLSVQDSVTGSWTYGYDNLNRLTQATGTGTYVGQSLSGASLGWSYDAFGNRLGQTSTSANIPSAWSCYGAAGQTCSKGSNLDTGTNNRVTYSDYNGAPGVGAIEYDAAGDMIFDGVNTYAYDMEGRICAVATPAAVRQYVYDAGGNRVAKGSANLVGGALTCNMATNGFSLTSSYVLGTGGEQLGELTGGGKTWDHSNVFMGGSLLATYTLSDTYLALKDWLGSKRVEVTPDGNIASFGSLPFGDDLLPTGTAPDASEQHFTGKERDTESGLDYFPARSYSSNMGRWMSPDPSGLYFADPSNPQTLNLYSYVANDPLDFIDPTGLGLLPNFVCTPCNAILNGIVNFISGIGSFLQSPGPGGGDHNDLPDIPANLRLFPTRASNGNHDITYRLRTLDGEHRPRGHYFVFEHQTQGKGTDEVENGGRFRAGDRNYVSPRVQDYDNEFPDTITGYVDSDQSFTFSRDRKYNPATQHQVWLKYGNGVEVPFQHLKVGSPNSPVSINGTTQLPLAATPSIAGEN